MIFRSKGHNESEVIDGCVNGKPIAQRRLYEFYFNYGMSVALRYVGSKDEAIEVVNDAFLKVFATISNYDISQPFKGWFRQIVIYTAIDHYRKNVKHLHESTDNLYINEQINPDIFSSLAEEEILECVQKLPASYRVVFVLYAVEGFKHHEIASMLKISEGTSKSNLAIARGKLKSLLSKLEKNYRDHG